MKMNVTLGRRYSLNRVFYFYPKIEIAFKFTQKTAHNQNYGQFLKRKTYNHIEDKFAFLNAIFYNEYNYAHLFLPDINIHQQL